MEAAHRHPATIAEGHITIPLPTRLVTRTMAQITTPAVTIVEAETAEVVTPVGVTAGVTAGVTDERVDRPHTNFLFSFTGAPLPLFATIGSLGLFHRRDRRSKGQQNRNSQTEMKRPTLVLRGARAFAGGS